MQETSTGDWKSGNEGSDDVTASIASLLRHGLFDMAGQVLDLLRSSLF
jgi:hypothetical protein